MLCIGIPVSESGFRAPRTKPKEPHTSKAPANVNSGTTMNKRMPNPKSSPSSARDFMPVENIS